MIEIRDPYSTFPGEWGVHQQPEDVAFLRLVEREKLARMFPAFENKIRRSGQRGIRVAGRSALNAQDRWESLNRDTVEVYEYVNMEGVWWVFPDGNLILSFVRNPLKGRAPFYIAKRFSFSKLSSQYEHVIGLMAAMARMNLLTIIAAEDAVHAETNIVGELIGEGYRAGRGAINYFTPGTQVAKMNNQVPFQVLQQADRLERQLRLVAAYPVQDDGISPNSFVTGRGLNELTSAVDREVGEYFTVLGDWLTEFDSMRLEWDEQVYGGVTKTVGGMRKGVPFNETYKPSVAIKGDYRTRRVYGAMAGFDEPTKIITGLQLMQADLIDGDTMRENIDGLENHTKIKERIRAEKAERVVFDTLMGLAQQGDPRALQGVMDMLPEGDMKKRLSEIFEPEEPDPAQQAAEQAAAGLAGGPPPDTQTVLSRLVSEGGEPAAVGGVQTTGQI